LQEAVQTGKRQIRLRLVAGDRQYRAARRLRTAAGRMEQGGDSDTGFAGNQKRGTAVVNRNDGAGQNSKFRISTD
jgi:hypothetical protein